MIKRICQFLGSLVVAALLTMAVLIGLGVSDQPPAIIASDHPKPKELGALRKAFERNAKILRAPGPAKLSVTRNELETLTSLWNGSGKKLYLVLDPRTDSLVLRAYLSFNLLGWQGAHGSSITLAASRDNWKPKIKIGALWVPSILWKQIIPRVLQPGPSPKDIQTQLNNVKEFRALKQSYEIALHQGPVLSDFVKGFAQNASFSAHKRTISAQQLKPYLGILRAYALENADRVVQAETLYQLVFASVLKRATPATVELESQAALAALSAALSPPRFSRLFTKEWPKIGWRIFRDDQGKKTFVAPTWRRTRVAGRQDLSHHLAVSVGLQLHFGESDTRYAGLMKEISDDDEGGSGFDPNDILANSAGQAFAIMAVKDQDSANTLARCLAEMPQTVIPALEDLVYPSGPVWRQTDAHRTQQSYDFDAIAIQLRELYIAKVLDCGKIIIAR